MNLLTNLNLTQNELQNAVIQNLAMAPSSPSTGQIYIDTSGTPVLTYWDGTAWITVGAGGGSVNSVTAADSTIIVGGTGTDPTLKVATGGVNDAQIAAGANIAYNKLATPTTAVSFGNQLLNNVATPTSSTDAATKGYVDSAIEGLNPKAAVIAASTANISLSSAPSSLDGVTLSASNRVLLKNQTTSSENGIYVFASTGAAFTRSPDMNTWAEVPAAYIWIEEGSTNADTAYICTSNPGGTLNTTAITWSLFSSAASISASAPITFSGNNISIALSTRIVLNGSNIDLQTGVVTPSTYSSVTVDTYGRVTSGSDISSTTGLLTKTTAGTFTSRTIIGTTGQIVVTNGNGVSGNPTLAFDTAARTNLGATGFYCTVGSGSASTYTIAQGTHGLGSSGNSYCDLICQVYDITSNPAVLIICDVSINTSTGAVTFTFAASQTLSHYRFTIMGK